jgi:D-alanyl-D-alanine dipeptidase
VTSFAPFDAFRAPDLAFVRERPDPPDTPVHTPLAPPPPGFSDLRAAFPDARFAIAYATDINFVGAALPGYGAPGAWLRSAAVDALKAAALAAREQGLRFIFYDAYRPVRATEAMWAWAENTGNRWLFDDGWVVRRSRHNTGIAVDLSLVGPDGEVLDMGSPFDAFVPASFTANASGRAAENRQLLRSLMVDAGFVPIDQEWWHFEWRLPEAARCDVPYGAHEAAGALQVP